MPGFEYDGPSNIGILPDTQDPDAFILPWPSYALASGAAAHDRWALSRANHTSQPKLGAGSARLREARRHSNSV